MMRTDESHPATKALLTWYSSNKRDLPWRANPEPYGVWLCEIIMQQTRIQQGLGYWNRFMAQYPTVADLAEAPAHEVMKCWEGLGYYSRARNLHAAAKRVMSEWGGRFPTEVAALRTLPGVGPYTAAAVASISAGVPVAAVDGNVVRVVTRFFAVDEPVDRPSGRESVQRGAEALLSHQQPGDHNQAMMDLGGQTCTPQAPRCSACPLEPWCLSAHQPALLQRRPAKTAKIPVQVVHWDLHWITDGARWILMERPAPGIWGGLWCPPVTEVPPPSPTAPPPPPAPPPPLLPAQARALPSPHPPVTHLLTHRRIHIRSLAWKIDPDRSALPAHWTWHTPAESAARPLPQPVTKAHPTLTKWLEEI
jgi:A/G-specific adenine glycosylase